MANTDVKEMVDLCTDLGLRVAFETGGGHYTVRDPDSKAKLFYISSTPSDTNFKYEIARHLRRLGLLKGNLKFGKFKTIQRKKKYGPIDMVALRKAQEQAESAGEHVPLLDDLNGQPEFFRKIPANSNGYVKEAQQEAIDNMRIKLSPRGAATKARLRKTLADKNMNNTSFVKIAMEVAQERDLRGWTQLNSGQSAIGKFLKEDDATLQIWGINLIEATLDKIDGLRWDTEPPEPVSGSELPVDPQYSYVTEETLLNILGNWVVKIKESIMQQIQEEVFEGAPSVIDNNWRDKYAEVLLTRLANLESTDDPEIYMSRLDKLVG